MMTALISMTAFCHYDILADKSHCLAFFSFSTQHKKKFKLLNQINRITHSFYCYCFYFKRCIAKKKITNKSQQRQFQILKWYVDQRKYLIIFLKMSNDHVTHVFLTYQPKIDSSGKIMANIKTRLWIILMD